MDKEENSTMTRDEIRLRAWEQDYENHRYQDTLVWSRFRWLFILEGALLFAAYSDSNIDGIYRLCFSVFMFLLVFLLSALIYKDSWDSRGFLIRKRKYEEELGISHFPENELPKLWKIMKGYRIAFASLLVLNLFNLAIIYDKIVFLYGSPVIGVITSVSALLIALILIFLTFINPYRVR